MYDGMVVLAGTVSSPDVHMLAFETAAKTPCVRRVVSEIVARVNQEILTSEEFGLARLEAAARRNRAANGAVRVAAANRPALLPACFRSWACTRVRFRTISRSFTS